MKRVLIIFFLLYLIINSAPIERRWGITKPVTDKSTEQQLAIAYDLIYNLEFDTAEVIYQKIIDKLPNSAEAHLGLSIAYRYTGKINDALIECQKALVLDSNAVGIQLNYADLLEPFRGGKLKEPLSDSARYALCIHYYEKALTSKHPISTYAHIGLWTAYLSIGQIGMASLQMFELGKKNYFPKMLQDFAYNMLITVAPDAIMITQGDDDTHPMLSIKEYKGFRKDVPVMKIGMLNMPKIVGLLRDSLNVPISYSDSELIKLSTQYDSLQGKPILLFPRVLANIIENARKIGRPVYFATTLERARMGEYQNNLVLEGLAWRVVDVKTKDSIDIDKVIKNMTEKYHLDNICKKENWPANMSAITRDIKGISIYYGICYNLMAEHYKKRGNKEKAVDCYRRLFQIVEYADNQDYMKTVLDKWLELKPDDGEAKKLKEKYFKGSK